MQKIQDTYEKRHGLTGIRIAYKGRTVDRNDLVKSFLVPEDSLVVFTAIDPVNTTVQHRKQGHPSFTEQLMQADIASPHQETLPSHHASQTANNHSDSGTTGKEPLATGAETGFNASLDMSGHSAAQYNPNFALPLTPRYASTMSSHALAQDSDGYSPQYQPRSQSRQHSRRSSSGLDTPPISVDSLRQAGSRPTTAPVVEGETQDDHHQRTKERSVAPSIYPHETLRRSGVKEERQSPVPFQSTSFPQNGDLEP
jgi:hypothetical protein